MRRTKTMLMGDLLEEFFKRPYVAAKVAEGKLPDTWREIVGDRAADATTELRLERHILHVRIQSSVLRSELFYPVSYTHLDVYKRQTPFARPGHAGRKTERRTGRRRKFGGAGQHLAVSLCGRRQRRRRCV